MVVRCVARAVGPVGRGDTLRVMDGVAGGERLAASLADRLDRLAFVDLSAAEVTARIIDTVAAWGADQGWRVYRRAPSVLPLPPPLTGQHSVLDVACARPTGPPVVVEVDQTDRRRTVDKLLAEAAAGRVPIWVRWSAGRITAPPPPVQLVRCPVTRYRAPVGRVSLHARPPAGDRPPPAHSASTGDAAAVELPLPTPGAG
jgi:hypothetical protein